MFLSTGTILLRSLFLSIFTALPKPGFKMLSGRFSSPEESLELISSFHLRHLIKTWYYDIILNSEQQFLSARFTGEYFSGQQNSFLLWTSDILESMVAWYVMSFGLCNSQSTLHHIKDHGKLHFSGYLAPRMLLLCSSSQEESGRGVKAFQKSLQKRWYR